MHIHCKFVIITGLIEFTLKYIHIHPVLDNLFSISIMANNMRLVKLNACYHNSKRG